MGAPPLTGDDDAVLLPVDGCLDLHAFAPRDVTSVVEEYLGECRRRGILEVRVIHGKGTGFQRRAVRELLRTLDFVDSFRNAQGEAGGWGATLVRLTPAPDGGVNGRRGGGGTCRT